jgi:hypothetical protein
MTMTIVFEFSLSSVNFNIILQSGVLPRPSGVLTYIFNNFQPSVTFGFAECGAPFQPFGSGTFMEFGPVAYVIA